MNELVNRGRMTIGCHSGSSFARDEVGCPGCQREHGA
jgi:hypothetical protein